MLKRRTPNSYDLSTGDKAGEEGYNLGEKHWFR